MLTFLQIACCVGLGFFVIMLILWIISKIRSGGGDK